VTGQPAGVTASFAQPQAAAGSAATLNLSADPAKATAGVFSLTVTASQGSFSRSLTFPLTVQIPATGTLTLTPGAAGLTVKPGTSAQLALVATRVGGFSAAVSMSMSGVPAGVTATLSSTTLNASGAFTVTFAAASSAQVGTYNLAVKLTGGNQSFSVPVSLTIASIPSFTSIVSTNALTIQAGGATVPITVSDGNYNNGFNSTITLILSGLPSGMNYTFLSGTAANNFVNITYGIYASASTVPGTYPITVSATGGGNSYKNMVYVTVTAAQTAAVKH
jgi:uncharacterized membrane protein